MIRRQLTAYIFLLLTVSPFTGFAAGQGGEYSVYGPVPRRLRPGLDARLKLYVELERTGQFERLYELFSETQVAHLKTFNCESKSAYAAVERGSGRFRMGALDFTPTSTRRVADGVYIVFGRLKSRLGGGFSEHKGSIEARWQNGEWYFSELGQEIE